MYASRTTTQHRPERCEEEAENEIYADLKAYAQERKIKPGEVIFMRQPKHNTLSTPYNPKPFVAEEKKATMVTASNGLQPVTRNSSHFKLILKQLAQSQENDVKKDDEKIPRIQQKLSDTKEECLPRRSKTCHTSSYLIPPL